MPVSRPGLGAQGAPASLSAAVVDSVGDKDKAAADPSLVDQSYVEEPNSKVRPFVSCRIPSRRIVSNVAYQDGGRPRESEGERHRDGRCCWFCLDGLDPVERDRHHSGARAQSQRPRLAMTA